MVAVFAVEIVALVRVAVGGEDGAAIWSILLLIFTPLAVVGLIGGGIVRAVRADRDRREGREGERSPERQTPSSKERER